MNMQKMDTGYTETKSHLLRRYAGGKVAVVVKVTAGVTGRYRGAGRISVCGDLELRAPSADRTVVSIPYGTSLEDAIDDVREALEMLRHLGNADYEREFSLAAGQIHELETTTR